MKTILDRHRQNLAREGMKMFENQFDLGSNQDHLISSFRNQAKLFNQMINYQGLYENLSIQNLSFRLLNVCDKRIDPIIGIDYKRHRNRHHLVCFSSNAFVVQKFWINPLDQTLEYDRNENNTIKMINGNLKQIRFYRDYEADELFIASLLNIGAIQQIYLFQIFDDSRIIDKGLLHTFHLHEQVIAIDVLQYDNGKNRIVVLIDSGWKSLKNFHLETDKSLILIVAQQAYRLRTMRIQSQGFIIASNKTHWIVYRFQEKHQAEQVNLFQMNHVIQDIQLFQNGHRYYVGIATHREQYIYQWRDGKKGFRGVARIRSNMVYKMNALTISYSREDNFFYFDQFDSDILTIYGYDITNGIFEKINRITKNIYRLDQKETISKLAVNLTFNFNVTFRSNVYVNRYAIDENRRAADEIEINRRNYALRELSVSLRMLDEKIGFITDRMNRIDNAIRFDVVYRNQNIEIDGHKNFLNKIFLKKIHSKQAIIDVYRNNRINDLLHNLYRIDQDRPIVGRKYFQSSIDIDGFLLLNKINEKNPEDFLYTDLNQDVYSNLWYRVPLKINHLRVPDNISSNITISSSILINGPDSNETITIRNKFVCESLAAHNLYVKRVDDLIIDDLPRMILTHRRERQTIKVPTQIDRLVIRNNLFASNLNDFNLTQLFDQIMFVNEEIHFTMPVHFGNDIRMNVMEIGQSINGIRIPEDLMDRDSIQNVFGKKKFPSIQMRELNATYLNTLRIPGDIVTLSRDEMINNDLRLNQLKIEGDLIVDGLIDNINFTHLDERYINSFQNHYTNLTFLKAVNVSRIIINGTINGLLLDQIYPNVYLKQDRVLYIPSEKIIQKMRCNNIVANQINGYDLNEFFRIETSENFHSKIRFDGSVSFRRIKLQGKIATIDVDDFLSQAITLNSYQEMIGGQNFIDGIEILNDFLITGKINYLNPHEWLLYSRPQNISASIRFKEIDCKMFIKDGDLDSNEINGDNFTDLIDSLIYLDRPETLNAILSCKNCSARNIITTYINLKNFTDFLQNYLSKSKPQTVIGAKQFFSRQYFEDIQTKNGFAGLNLKDLKYQAITREGYNIIRNPIIINGDLKLISGRLNFNLINGIEWNGLLTQLVHRNHNGTIEIQGDIRYQSGLDFLTDIDTTKLNNYIAEEALMTTNHNHTIYGKAIFNRKLITSNDIVLFGYLNSINLTQLDLNVLKTNERGELIVGVGSRLNFIGPFRAKDVTVIGRVDDISLDRDALLWNQGEQNVHKLILKGSQIFNGSLNIIGKINQFDREYLKNIILANSTGEQTINFQKTFSTIYCPEISHKNGFIHFNIINSIDLNEFNSTVIYSNVDRIVNGKGFKFLNNVTINNPRFQIFGLINGIPLADIVRLDRIKQTITGEKIFDSIVFNDDIEVHGLWNGIDVPKLSQSAFQVYGNQHIKTPIKFIAPVFVLSNSTVLMFNQYRPEDLISLYGNRTLKGKVNFHTLLGKNLFVLNQLVDGINLTTIEENALLVDDPNGREQILSGTLQVEQAQFNQNVTLTSNLNNLDLSEIVKNIANKFNPNLNPQNLSQQLWRIENFLAFRKQQFLYSNFEIAYFQQSNNIIVDEEKFFDLDFHQRYKFPNYFDPKSIKNRLKNIWQTLNVENQFYISEIWNANESTTSSSIDDQSFRFRLIRFDVIAQQSRIVLDKILTPGKMKIKKSKKEVSIIDTSIND
ncbi:hypothetical protein QR98_0099180 [Sarcoptes scabiei]|uniref:Uncharacterized protein n=1 Tax=Sarcoptes scabiei TaxID=52283 RepID=A0A132AK89_SARSC|nr:hypothetical protein QR98_0099180 [Sarcoptes scabiei]